MILPFLFSLSVFPGRQAVWASPTQQRTVSAINKHTPQLKWSSEPEKPSGAWRQVWLKQPLVDLEAINQRLDVVDAFVGDSPLREALRDIHLRGVCLQSCLPAAFPGPTKRQ